MYGFAGFYSTLETDRLCAAIYSARREQANGKLNLHPPTQRIGTSPAGRIRATGSGGFPIAFGSIR